MANTYINDLTDTWDNINTQFVSIKVTVTDTASHANSHFINFVRNSNSIFRVKKDGTVFANVVSTGVTNVGSLPSAVTMGAGARSFVNDASNATFLVVVTGGGSNKVPVVSDGTNWLVG